MPCILAVIVTTGNNMTFLQGQNLPGRTDLLAAAAPFGAPRGAATGARAAGAAKPQVAPHPQPLQSDVHQGSLDTLWWLPFYGRSWFLLAGRACGAGLMTQMVLAVRRQAYVGLQPAPPAAQTGRTNGGRLLCALPRNTFERGLGWARSSASARPACTAARPAPRSKSSGGR